MKTVWIIGGVALFLVAAVLLIAYICYRMAFYSAPKNRKENDLISLPDGKIYEQYWPQMTAWAKQVREMPHEPMRITSFDGLKLTGKYYEYAPGAPIELMFHGYRGTAERDLSGGVQRCFRLKRSALIVDQRCSGSSEGRTITFGIREYRDCLAWVEHMLKRFGPDVKIILTGISMGASTVLIAAGQALPPNVVGVLADCGYSSAKEIIQKVIKEMKLPPKLAYPFVKLAARVYGGFDLEQTSPKEALKDCKVPVIFFHGEDDRFVPCQMSRDNYEACPSRKMLVTMPGAGHGLCILADPEKYISSLESFFEPEMAER